MFIISEIIFPFQELLAVTRGFSAPAALQNHLGAFKKQECQGTQPGSKIHIWGDWSEYVLKAFQVIKMAAKKYQEPLL